MAPAGLRRHAVALGVEQSCGQVLVPHRTEGAPPYVQGDRGHRHAGSAYGVQQRWREVEPGGGRRHRAGLPGEHGLIALPIPGPHFRIVGSRVPADVRRQGITPSASNRGMRGPDLIRRRTNSRSFDTTVARSPPGRSNTCPGRKRPGCPGQGLPCFAVDLAAGIPAGLHRPGQRPEHQELHPAAGFRLRTPQACGEHPGIVEHQEVPRPQQPGKVAKHPVSDDTLFPPDLEQPRSVPPGSRHLGDGRRGQVVVVIVHLAEAGL